MQSMLKVRAHIVQIRRLPRSGAISTAIMLAERVQFLGDCSHYQYLSRKISSSLTEPLTETQRAASPT